jgi:hypothetical protein
MDSMRLLVLGAIGRQLPQPRCDGSIDPSPSCSRPAIVRFDRLSCSSPRWSGIWLATYRPKGPVLWSAVDHFHHRLMASARRQKTGHSCMRISAVRLGLVRGTHASRNTGDHNDNGQEVSHEKISIRWYRRGLQITLSSSGPLLFTLPTGPFIGIYRRCHRDSSNHFPHSSGPWR